MSLPNPFTQPLIGDIRSYGCYYEAIKDVTIADVIEYDEPEEDEDGEEKE